VIRRRAINALARFSGGTDMFLPRCMECSRGL